MLNKLRRLLRRLIFCSRGRHAAFLVAEDNGLKHLFCNACNKEWWTLPDGREVDPNGEEATRIISASITHGGFGNG